MRTAVFITPETLLSLQSSGEKSPEYRDTAVFRLASRSVKAINRLKQSGFMIIGLGREDMFHGFATQNSCGEFLSASALDDVIISHQKEQEPQCTSAMIHAAAKWLLDLDRSFFIGRDAGDVRGAELTGCTPLKIGNVSDSADAGSSSGALSDAVDKILALSSSLDERPS